jgi:branched-chain amino acid aminotransferase
MIKANKIITDHGIVAEADFRKELSISGQSVYEVIRVIDGVALFLEDHFERLMKSFEILELSPEMDYAGFSLKIDELIQLNQKTEGNVKFLYTSEGNLITWSFSFIPHSYPSPKDYLYGVKTGLLRAERENPNAKVVQQTVRERADQLIAEQSLYEVLLVDRDGLITEGSRSNVFFVKDEVFYTAQASKVLVGITRQKVMECLNELNFRVTEEAVAASRIYQFDAVFLTGTSPKVLPVRTVGNHVFDSKPACVRRLMDVYDDRINQYIQKVQAERKI